MSKVLRLGYKNINEHFNFECKIKLLLIASIVSINLPKCKVKLIDSTETNKYDINIDLDYKELVDSLENYFTKNNCLPEFSKYKNLFKHTYGVKLVYPISVNFALYYSIVKGISVLTIEEVLEAAFIKHKSINPLSYYMSLFLKSRLKEIKKDELLREIEDTAENLGYFKAVCNKHKIEYDFIKYVKYMYIIHMLFEILDNPEKQEYDRSIVVSLSNDLEVSNFVKNKDPLYYLIKDMLSDRFIYSVYYNEYKTERGKQGTNILYNVICKNTKENRVKIVETKKKIKEHYPKIKIVEQIKYYKR